MIDTLIGFICGAMFGGILVVFIMAAICINEKGDGDD